MAQVIKIQHKVSNEAPQKRSENQAEAFDIASIINPAIALYAAIAAGMIDLCLICILQ